MDHMMPKMDGIEATHRIREDYPEYRNVPVIAFTANAVEEAKQMLLREGMDDFLPKPLKGSDLEAILRKWLPADKVIQ
jgi:CheY-like chemotaxis protein